jgi:hypothetical protein
MKNSVINIRIDKVEAKELRILAEQFGFKSVSAFIRFALYNQVEKILSDKEYFNKFYDKAQEL